MTTRYSGAFMLLEGVGERFARPRDLLHVTRRRDAEEVLDVDDADAAQLHVMAQHVVRISEQDIVGMAFDDHEIVRDQAMAAIDEIERAFALADAAVAEEQHADAVDVEKAGVHRDARRHRLFEEVRRARDRRRRHRRRREQRHAALLAFDAELVERSDAFRDDEAGDVEAGDVADALLAQPRRKALEVLRLRRADDLHAPRLDVLVVAGEREPRLLHARPRDHATQPVVAGDELEQKVIQLAQPERSDGGRDEVFVAHPTILTRARVEQPAPVPAPASAPGWVASEATVPPPRARERARARAREFGLVRAGQNSGAINPRLLSRRL